MDFQVPNTERGYHLWDALSRRLQGMGLDPTCFSKFQGQWGDRDLSTPLIGG
jgi:hypothetical protein